VIWLPSRIDEHFANMLMCPRPGRWLAPTVLDWSTETTGWTGTSLSPHDRRTHEALLIGAYHSALLAHGVMDNECGSCWNDYRFAMVQGPLVAVCRCAYGTRTDRGDQMFAAMVARSCTVIRDLKTFSLVDVQML
jgi:hypothetical protein